ncbi:MAG TPA: PAS domain S-box protein, partial [Thiomicrospira sp.]|nr:PAS domain S-box protein [Thiomicrospira sp.]
MDQIESNVLIADNNLNIIYMNDAMKAFFESREHKIQTVMPDFKTSEIIGSNIDIFHKNPAHNRAMLDSIKEPTKAKIILADYHLDLNVIPVFNRARIKTTTVVEWQDKTAEVQLIEQVDEAINAAQAGLLDRRIDVSRTEGVARQLSESINQLLENIEKPINSTVSIALALSEGNLTEHIHGEFLGRFAVMQDSLNVAVDNLGSLIAQTKTAVDNVSSGSQQIYQGSIDLNERTQNQAASLEQTASSMEQMTAAVKQNAENAQQASEVTHTSADLAKSGVQVMDNAINAMEQINESSQKINDIISLIDSIAFQTNLLALNAA